MRSVRKQRFDFGPVECETGFGFFGSNVDLEQDGKIFFQFGGSGVEALGEFEGVDGVDGMEEFGGGAGLVRLKVADHVELGVLEVGECAGFFFEFLNAVLAEEALPGDIGFANRIRREGLGAGHQGDFARGPATTGGGGADPLTNLI